MHGKALLQLQVVLAQFMNFLQRIGSGRSERAWTLRMIAQTQRHFSAPPFKLH